MLVPGKHFWLWLVALGIASAAVVLYAFPPEQHAWYPRCIFHAVTGLNCPGCGGLRAAHHLLHGDFAAAFRSNPLLVTLIPALGLGFGYYHICRRLNKPIPALFQHPAWLWVLVCGVIVFAVLRNLR